MPPRSPCWGIPRCDGTPCGTATTPPPARNPVRIGVVAFMKNDSTAAAQAGAGFGGYLPRRRLHYQQNSCHVDAGHRACAGGGGGSDLNMDRESRCVKEREQAGCSGASVCGALQVKRKGRSVHVEPVAGIDAERLRALIQALLLLQQNESGGGTSEASAASRPDSPEAFAANEVDADGRAHEAAGGEESTPMQTVRLLETGGPSLYEPC